jgi:thioredoxin 2
MPPGSPVCGRCKQRLDLSGAPQSVDEKAYRAALVASPVPVLVDFWAEWCGPCRMAAPLVDRVARDHAGRLIVLKVNTDHDPEPSAELGIRGIPTFIVFSGGNEVARQSGLPSPGMFKKWVQSQLAG